MNGSAAAEGYLILCGSGQRFALTSGQSWAIGRGEGCAVLLDSRSVSRIHALIQRRDAGDYYLVDLGSRNGSFINGQRVSVPARLNDNDRLVFAEQQLIFRAAAKPETESSAPSTSLRDAPTTALHTQTLTTIVVVDIRDFTPLARTLPESLLSRTIGTWFLHAGQIAQHRGSWAQKYIGDAVMAVWIHDRKANIQEDVARALRAVCDIYGATGEISKNLALPNPLRIGAGVNTGPAIVGGADYTALGDTVNAAFRLEAATKSIGLSVALGSGAFDALASPNAPPFRRCEVELKGYDQPSTAWAISFEELDSFLVARGA